MPELPEVEVLVRELDRLLRGRRVRRVEVKRRRVLGTTSPRRLADALRGATFSAVTRRGKFLVFNLRKVREGTASVVAGHLGMTGRMYLQSRNAPLPKHAAVILDLGGASFVFEDTRYFGKFTLDTTALARLGPEPLEKTFTAKELTERLSRSSRPVKIKLLDQSVVAGIGNIYASEALFRAGISPLTPARRLTKEQIKRLWKAIRRVLAEAIRFGSTTSLSYAGTDHSDKLFYFGRAGNGSDFYDERLRVYDREGRPCSSCGSSIRRIFQAGRSTFYCGRCQKS